MSYPITIHKRGLVHSSGTKEYHIVVLHSSTARVYIFRWNRVGSWGQTDVIPWPVNSVGSFDEMVVAKYNEKIKRGYTQKTEVSKIVWSAEDFLSVLGASYYYKLGKETLLMLDPDLPTKGVRDSEPAKYEKQGDRFVQIEKPKLLSDSELIIENHSSDNPNWGTW